MALDIEYVCTLHQHESESADLDDNTIAYPLHCRVMDKQLFILLAMAWLAGLAMPLGAILAKVTLHLGKKLQRELIHFSASLGGGALISAVALVLVPHGLPYFNPLLVTVIFSLGAFVFLLLDRAVASQGESHGQLLAMLLDFIPECIALGATIGSGSSAGTLLVILIAIQNVPEGFNAYQESAKRSNPKKNLVGLYFLLSIAGPLAAGLGMVTLSGRPTILAGLMLFAAGGILYLTFQDVAPQARYRGHWAPPLGAVLGFLIGVVGKMILESN